MKVFVFFALFALVLGEIYYVPWNIQSYSFLINILDSATNDPICTGLFLSAHSDLLMSDIGLTAAQCLCDENGKKRQGIQAILGKFHERGESPHVKLYNISYVICHPTWIKSGGKAGDIGLFRLDQPANFTAYVYPVDLVQDNETLKDGEICTVHGWGATGVEKTPLGETKYTFPKALQECKLRISSKCDKWWPDIFDKNKMICAVGERMDGDDRMPCSPWVGDTGGPLICARHEVLPGVIVKVVGIFSFTGFGDMYEYQQQDDSEKYYTSVYTRLSAFGNWIEFWKMALTKVDRYGTAKTRTVDMPKAKVEAA